jgi:hypothetical protein
MSGVALGAGESEIVGHAVAKELKRQGWTICSLGRQPIEEWTRPSAPEACQACHGETDRGDD